MASMRIVNLPTDLYNQICGAAQRNGADKVGPWLSDFLRDFGFADDDLKVVLRVPPEVQADRIKCEEFLAGKVRHLIAQLFPGEK